MMGSLHKSRDMKCMALGWKRSFSMLKSNVQMNFQNQGQTKAIYF